MPDAPKQPAWIAEVIDAWCGCNAVMQENLARDLWERALQEGRIITTQRGFPTIYESGLFISLPLVADKEENNDKEDYEGGVNWP